MATKNFKTSTILYDSLIGHIEMIANKKENLQKLVKQIQYINDKNTDVLNTNIVGYPLLINDNDQNNILACLELTKKQLHDIVKSSPRMDGVGKIIDQFAFALPLMILAGVLKKKKQIELSQGILLFTFYRPYASKITSFFRLGTVDEKAMEYTTMIYLNDKSFIHKYGSVYAVLVESAKTTYDSYIDILAGVGGSPTDDMIFNNIFYSAIFSKTGSWIKSLYGSYLEVKNSGKALKYELPYYSSFDDDSQEDKYEENNINSNSAAKRAIVSKAISKFNITPIDTKLVNMASTYGNGSPSKAYENFLKTTIDQISASMSEKVGPYIDAIVGAFLDSADITGAKNSASEVSTIKFLAYSKKIFKTSHTFNANIREEQNITEEILTKCSPKYCSAEIKTKRKMKLALYMYFVLFIQKA